MSDTITTQTEWLIDFWECVNNPEFILEAKSNGLTIIHILKNANDMAFNDDFSFSVPSKKRLKELRTNFIQKKYLIGNKCFGCNKDVSTQTDRMRVRHHILSLSRGGNNRRINIVTLCGCCHKNVHPWLKCDCDNIK